MIADTAGKARVMSRWLVHARRALIQFADSSIGQLGRVPFPSRHRLDDQYGRRGPRIPVLPGQPQDTTDVVERFAHQLDVSGSNALSLRNVRIAICASEWVRLRTPTIAEEGDRVE
jgi:hypothetical protein